ncbi:MAG TPA: hypothetical protein VHJ20_13185 [Polyangia bacterium]|nr:hypothetical protein [Polyangia bacterium]
MSAVLAKLVDAVAPPRARPGRDDVAGFAVIGQPFSSGDLLCLRKFPASTFGPGYTSVWHRAPDGAWTVYTSVAPEQSCPRFIGAAIARAVETAIDVAWTGAAELDVRVPAAGLRWRMRVAATPVTRLMNVMMALMPAWMFRSDLVLSMMSLMSTALLAAGRFRLRGRVPNRQWFQAGPRGVWMVPDAQASIGERDLGAPRPLPTQATLGEVPLPQRGVLMTGGFSFEAYAPERHLPARPAAA